MVLYSETAREGAVLKISRNEIMRIGNPVKSGVFQACVAYLTLQLSFLAHLAVQINFI